MSMKPTEIMPSRVLHRITLSNSLTKMSLFAVASMQRYAFHLILANLPNIEVKLRKSSTYTKMLRSNFGGRQLALATVRFCLE